MDLVSSVRYCFFEDFSIKNKVLKVFREIVKVFIKYSIYLKKELYILVNLKKKVYDESIDIFESFYGFRDSIDFGNEVLWNYYFYYCFLGNYLDNLFYE